MLLMKSLSLRTYAIYYQPYASYICRSTYETTVCRLQQRICLTYRDFTFFIQMLFVFSVMKMIINTCRGHKGNSNMSGCSHFTYLTLRSSLWYKMFNNLLLSKFNSLHIAAISSGILLGSFSNSTHLHRQSYCIYCRFYKLPIHSLLL